MTTEKMHFRVETMSLLKEIVECGLPKNMGVLKIPINIFKNLLADVAQRATELNDPIMNQLMFDLSLYELPKPCTDEYHALMDQVYAAAEKQVRKEKRTKPLHPGTKS